MHAERRPLSAHHACPQATAFAGLLTLALLLPWPATGEHLAVADSWSCGSIKIDGMGFSRLEALQETPGLEAWAEVDDLLFACGEEAALIAVGASGYVVTRRWRGVAAEDLFVVRGAHPGSFSVHDASLEVLTRGGPYSVVRASARAARAQLGAGLLPGEGAGEHEGCGRTHVQPFAGEMVLARQSANRVPRGGGTVFGPEAQQAVDAVHGARWYDGIVTLAGWNRHTHGTQIDLARDWLIGQFNGIAGLAVTTQSFQVGGTTVENVIATLPGTTRPDDWVLVGGHYDATSQNTSQAAPGAEDNASGCSGVVELARVISDMSPEATVIFLCYAGEEQGLHGSAAHASRLVNQGDDAKIDLMLNMDMIGYTGDADLDSLLETESPFASLLDLFEDAAAEFTTLRTVTSLFAFGSDHVPYLNRNMPALLTIENDWDSYPSYHRTSDLPANITQEMGYQTLRMNAAVLAHVTGASADSGDPPLFANGFESGDTSGWSGVLD